MSSETETPTRKESRLRKAWVWDVLFLVVLVIGGYFRFTGIKWDESYHLHPDERFLTMVESAISPVQNLSEYFNSSQSSLNPNNRGYTFYVYGTLPIFTVRYVAEWLGQTGYDQVNVVGRVLSGIFDLGTLVFVYLIGKRLYRNARLGWLAALFSALAVLQIQLSHYFTVDNFANFFVYAAIYVAVLISGKTSLPALEQPVEEKRFNLPAWLTGNWRSFILYALFGILYGMAMASKVSVWALAALLPLAALLHYLGLPEEQKQAAVPVIWRNMVLAGLLAFLTFRIFQPYAFMGPGFLDFKINPSWLSSLKELRTLSSGNVDVPYALQWADRPITFTVKNLVLWGLGLPLGVLSLTGLLWMTWRMFKGEWKQNVLLWGWVVFVLVTQSLNWVRSMRYIITIYPALALIAAWTVVTLWDSGSSLAAKVRFNWRKVLSGSAAVLTIAGTALWAFAFTSIYTRPVTRVAASQWIYENIPGAINLEITNTAGKVVQQPLGYQNSAVVSSESPYVYGFEVYKTGLLQSITLEHVLNQQVEGQVVTLTAILRKENEEGGLVKGAALLQSDFKALSDSNGEKAALLFDPPVQLGKGVYQLEISLVEPGTNLVISGAAALNYEQDGEKDIQYLPPPVLRLTAETPYQVGFVPAVSGTLTELNLNRVVDLSGSKLAKTLTVIVTDPAAPEQPLATGTITSTFQPVNDPRGEAYQVTLNQPVSLDNTVGYTLEFRLSGEGALGFYGDVPVVESTWDDAIPLGMYGYNQFGYSNGIYGSVRNLELYWDDTESKLERFELTLDQSDAIFISSNRQWGTITRVPQRYPLTIQYYRALLGCPEDKDLIWCYSVAQPGMFRGQLGFELAAVFQNDPQIGSFKINDQFAEEAFTVYDHPKVLIFRKTVDYDPQVVREVLGAVDLGKAMHLNPGQVGKITTNLALSSDESKVQQSGGTFAELFPASSLLNRKPWTAALAWYLVLFLLGAITWPILRFFLRGLADRGYAFSRLAGLLLLAYFTWLAGSLGGTFSRLTITCVLVGLVLLSALFVFLQRKEIFSDLRRMRKTILAVEMVMLVFFLIDLGIRIGNPDLWHPWKGGEKPMDLSYFTAVLKSTTFPPYDPWYSGGYINYYYYGFVIVGVLVKLLGILPNLAYNLIIPTLFAFTGLGAFSLGWNLFAKKNAPVASEDAVPENSNSRSLFAGLAASLGVLILGNLGTVRMFGQGLQRLVAPDGGIDSGSFFQHIGWFFGGLGRFFSGGSLPYGFGDWYWIPSRAIPGDVITEFPFFTFTYADLHAHMIALPITLLALGWALSVLLQRWDWDAKRSKWDVLGLFGSLFLGAFFIGALRPTNTWDFPTYLLFTAIVVFYTAFKYAAVPAWLAPRWPEGMRRLVYAGFYALLLAGLSLLFYQPFVNKYAQAYGSVDAWKGEHTRLKDFLVHWGWQLFLIVTWLVWETREWLANTPLSSVKKCKPYLGYMEVVGALLLLVLVLLTVLGIHIGWFVGLLGVWVLLLLLRADQPDGKRVVLFSIGTAILLTLFVELFALQGDIGRMNTVFKFYFQAWTLFSLSAAASLVWLLPAVLNKWQRAVGSVWQVVLALFIFSALLYPVTAATDKVRDRISDLAPRGLDGMAFMTTSHYFDANEELDLSQDYAAIQWMRENIKGSPVIIETNTVEYRWGNRITIYTGLPGVLGWNWHQRQQRGSVDYNNIEARLAEIPLFYQTENVQNALDFLERYDVSYIILGQMERAYYPGAGLEKFAQYDGVYWTKVYGDSSTFVYEVLKSGQD